MNRRIKPALFVLTAVGLLLVGLGVVLVQARSLPGEGGVVHETGVGDAGIELNKTVGADPNVCSSTDELAITDPTPTSPLLYPQRSAFF